MKDYAYFNVECQAPSDGDLWVLVDAPIQINGQAAWDQALALAKVVSETGPGLIVRITMTLVKTVNVWQNTDQVALTTEEVSDDRSA